MATFIAIVRSDSRYGYAASFPDFPGCTAHGKILENVIAKAREALAAHIQNMLDGHQQVGAPTSAEAIALEPGILLAAIEIPDDVRTVQIEIAVPALALVRIDSIARRHGLSRAVLLVQSVDRWAVQEDMARDTRGPMSGAPTLFDFQNPLELRVEPVEELMVRDEGRHEKCNSLELGGTLGVGDDITTELARLIDRSAGSRSPDQYEAESTERKQDPHK